MPAPQSSPRPLPTSEDLSRLGDLFENGRFLDAYLEHQAMAPIEEWQGRDALILGGRLAFQWGSDRIGHRLHRRLFQENSNDPLAIFYESSVRWNRHGDWAALKFVRQHVGDCDQTPASLDHAFLVARHARLLGSFRDFTAAQAAMELALAAYPEDAWLRVEESCLLESRDDYEQALQINDLSLELRPWYRPAVHQRAHLLQLLNREEEAIDLLHRALDHLESGNTARLLVGIHEDRAELDRIPPLLDLAEKYLPWAEAADLRWLHARRSTLAHLAGDRPAAIRWARENGTYYFKRVATALEGAASDARRVVLPVSFVRQHHMTCAPATLAALTAFWQRPVPHLEIPDAICYDGSLDHAERDWAEKQGWLVKEFRPTWEITRALLDRGCPFSMVTVAPESAHMQAVIGYDSAANIIIVRDPFQRRLSEWLAPEYSESNAAHGPRAMLIVPMDRAAVLADLELPDEALYDATYHFRRHLYFHRRDQAAIALKDLEALAPKHLLTRWSQYDLAYYDTRLHDALTAVRAIREDHPKDNSWRLAELNLVRRLDDPVTHRTLLHELGSPRDALVAFRRDYAEDLARDSRRGWRAERILLSVLRRNATSPKNLRAYANLLWARGDRSEAHHLYRLAACCAEKTEFHWDSYFIASRHLGATEEAIALLRNRVARLGHLSTQPARTLYDALAAVRRTEEALAELAAAQARSPTDGELLLFHAYAVARVGRITEAQALLAAAKPHSHSARWLKTAANISELRRDYPEAIQHWRGVATVNPIDVDAHNAIVRLLEITEGRAAAIDHLYSIGQSQPQFVSLRQDLVRLLKQADRIPDALALTATILESDPLNDWTLRERALLLMNSGRIDEATLLADEALQIAPNAVASHAVKANVLRNLGRVSEAHECYRRAITLSIDADWLFDSFVDTCPDQDARRAAIDFLHGELMRQNSLNGAAMDFRLTARGIVSIEELTAMLRTYHERRPDCWDAWCALGTHLREAGANEDALQLGLQAASRFPLLPRMWTDLAEVQAALGNREEQIKHLQKALELSPGWSRAARQLSTAYEQLHQLEAAAEVLERAVRMEPNESTNHGFLADILWRLGRKQDAITAIETALELSPNYNWAWSRLQDWSTSLGNPDRPKELARTFTQTRSGQATAWLQYVKRAMDDPDIESLLDALDRAAALNPRDEDAWDLRAQLLVKHRRYEEALAACSPPVFGDNPPHTLKGRAAWVNYRQGQRPEATEALRKILETQPDYLWGWNVLTIWAWETRDWKTIEESAKRWAWLDPENATAQGYVAAAHKQAGRTEAWLDALSKAIAIDPQYDYALNELFAHHLKQKQSDKAEALLVHYDTHYPAADATLARLRLAQHCRERPAVRRHLRALAIAPAASKERFDQGVELILEAGHPDLVELALAEVLDNENALPSVAKHWIQSRLRQQKRWSTLWTVSRGRHRPERAEQLLEAAMNVMGKERSTYPVRILRWFNRKRLRASNATWSATLYALSNCSLHHSVADWAHDFQTRSPKPEPWTLFNLVLSLQELGRHQKAVEALELALAQPPDHTYEKLLVWRAHEHLLRGETAAARELLNKINSADWSKFLRSVELLCHVLRDVQSLAEEARTAACRDALKKLRDHTIEAPTMVNDRCLRCAYRRTLYRLGHDSGDWWLRWRSKLPLQLANPDPEKAKKLAFAIGFSAICYWIFFHSRVLH